MRNTLEREREIADLYARFDDLTEAEFARLMKLDGIGVLCHLVKDAGLTMRLHGEPIEPDALRSSMPAVGFEPTSREQAQAEGSDRSNEQRH